MKKTFRQCAIDYIKNRRLCKGYVDYIVSSLNKLERIEQIIERTEGTLGLDNYTVQQIREVLNG
jgi:hypothetical protein